MDSAELSRKVAEAMGGQECTDRADVWHTRKCDHKYGDWTRVCNAKPFDLADARDREAAIAWWKATTDGAVSIGWHRLEVLVLFFDAEGGIVASVEAETVGEAFGRAFLAAMGAGE